MSSHPLRSKSIFGHLFVVLCSLFALVGLPVQAVELDAEARAYIEANPVVTIGVITDNEPYSWVDNGRVAGFSIDVLEEIAGHTGLRFDYRPGSWPEIYPAFLRGEVDAIDEISYRPERAKLMLFTEPYHYRQTVIMHDGARPLPPMTTLEDLKPYRVGIVRDIYYKNAFTDRDIAVTEYDALPNLLRALAFGWIDAIAGPEVTLSFLARKAGFSHIGVAGRVAMDGLEIEDFRIGVLHENEPLHRIIAAGLAAIPPARFNELVEVWQEFGGQAIGTTPSFRLSEQHAAYVRRLGPVRVGIMRDYAPFSFVDGGNVQGLAVDVLARIQDLTGLQVIPVADRWPVLFDLFRRGEIDVIANISDNEARRDFTRFSDPYYVIPNVVFTRDAGFQLDSLDDLQGRRIALGSGIFYETPMRDRFGDAIVAFSSQDSMFRALAEGSVDVVVAALPNGNHWVRELGLTDIRIAGEFRLAGSDGEDLRFGVRPALEPLANIINLALGAISQTERRTIENRWLGADSRRTPDTSISHITLTESEQAYLAARANNITICTDPAWMPLEGLDRHGRHTGISSEFLKLFEERLGVTFEVHGTRSWRESLDAVKTGHCDLLPMAMQTAERLAYLDFTTPYYTVPNVLLARVEVPFIDTLAQLDDELVGIVHGYAFAELLRTRYPGLKLVEVDNEIDGLQRLQLGEIQAYVSTLATASHHLQELGLADIKVIGRIPGDWTLSIATRKGDPVLQTIAQKMIDSLSDEDRQQVESRWRTVRLEQHVDYTLLWQLMAGGVLILALLFVWNRKLGALNRRLGDANERLAELSITDSLTGVGNRKFFDQEYERSFRWCQRHQVGFTVAMVDIDHFKHINDTWGHKAGDDCLQALAQCMKTHARRETDRIARIGGEEFVIFGTWESEPETLARFEQLRIAVENMRVLSGSAEIALTLSIGLTTGVPSHSDRAGEFLERADRALYKAKRSGRNRVVHDRITSQ